MTNQNVLFFGDGHADGDASQKILLGSKGANLAEMTKIGLPVPPGFTISTNVCSYFYKNEKKYPANLKTDVAKAIEQMNSSLKNLGCTFGNSENPLLVSVRSGAPVSMPGMMDTVLNLGLNDQTVEGLIKASGDARFAYDSYRRFVMMYSNVVLGVSTSFFESELEEMKADAKVEEDTELTADQLKLLVKRFKLVLQEHTGKIFPENPHEQLWGAISAVFQSWMNPRAITYRSINNIPQDYGTAVNVQAMVYGNMGNNCATGVAFTRDPSTGDNKFFGEFLINAQGEDVVSGIRTPHPINEESFNDSNKEKKTLSEAMSDAYADLVLTYKKLEKHYGDMQDIEFTIQNGKLFLLQTRSGKRTAAAAVTIAVDMVNEGLIDKRAAIQRVTPGQLDNLLHPRLDPNAKIDLLTRGLPASPGAVSGKVVFDPDTAEDWVREKDEAVILVRIETSPEDIHGMNVARGILTARGGMTSHAAVVARGMGKSCVAGCSELHISYANKSMMVGGREFKEGDLLTLDGTTGRVMLGEVPTIFPELKGSFHTFMSWVDEFRKLKVRCNADSPKDSQVALDFGAEGIGLCRTEHMFFEEDRIGEVRKMILAEDGHTRKEALANILPMQRGDFHGIFKVMQGKPVTIRLLDPPLHEFLPHELEEVKRLAAEMGIDEASLRRRKELLHEFNPMLGHRGCRLGISFPEIYRMQVRAIMEAACRLKKEESQKIEPEIMVPLVGAWKELAYIRAYCADEIQQVFEEQGIELPYSIGTMIELPRAALTADQIAHDDQGKADFFSFGTNDLTQTTYGLSRDDAGSFLGNYLDRGLYSEDPFVSVDMDGVGELMKIATQKAKQVKPDMKLGICGEHGGEAKSVHFCHTVGLDYVSCSPYRVPVARLAAAHAAMGTTSIGLLP